MDWMLYGANGYTGALIAREAKSQGKSPILAGRSAAKISALRDELQLPARVFSLKEPSAIEEGLRGVSLVLNCAGPFSKTAEPLIRACIAARAHYLDVTGELDVFEAARLHDADAKAAGVVLCPGVAFDLVPTDCTALMLKKALPEATTLSLGFDMSGVKMSAGTAKTFVEGLGKPGKVRRGGRLVDFPVGKGLRRIDFGRGEKLAMPIPWGDVSTAYYTTGIPNITAYAPVSPVMAAMARLTGPLAPLLGSRGVQNWLKSWVEKNIGGPDAAEREASRSWIWGEASDASGRRRVIRILTLNGYSLTVFSALAITEHVLANECPRGFQTPAALMGEDFILTLPGTSMLTSPRQTA
ncbi:MAG: saccharopine dehydrogenase NADP-binding domain-containing protein [Beijerinckiaceae bacterium]|nr:saccharopine dehydrogenase NADP-binding domain-containing protein [Beijerinckiaceae bacterium]MCI0736965.1 saccharopine dehydrogenase NADP-binding domain-containing protein [Beijerinckiaceae bacterium]